MQDTVVKMPEFPMVDIPKLEAGAAEATAAFREFRGIMDRHGVTAYRAVTTSAAREARNGQLLLRRIRNAAKIELLIISGDEEARLVRVAVEILRVLTLETNVQAATALSD